MRNLYLLLKDIQDKLLINVEAVNFIRDVYYEINWEEDALWLIWERWVGKTTLLLQKLNETKEGFYFSADNPWVIDESLFKFVYYINKELWTRIFYIDEIHKYPNWTAEIKSLIDSIPGIKIVFSWSSSLDLFKWVLDLWRRVSFYNVYTLNYKEFLQLFYNEKIESYTFEEVLNNHEKIALKYGNSYGSEKWRKFIEIGQYPYSMKLDNYSFQQRFINLLDKIILEDIPVFLNMQTASLDKIRKIFYFIANTTPSELSFTFLSKKIGVDKSIVENVLVLLNKIWLIHLVPKFWDLSTRVRKEYKILLWNTNLYSAYNISTNIWILRESFLLSVLKKIDKAEIFLPWAGDFILITLDQKYTFEVWWKWKTKKQIIWVKNSFVVSDDIVVWKWNKIPLWIFWLIK
jgi:uncharacterized protein